MYRLCDVWNDLTRKSKNNNNTTNTTNPIPLTSPTYSPPRPINPTTTTNIGITTSTGARWCGQCSHKPPFFYLLRQFLETTEERHCDGRCSGRVLRLLVLKTHSANRVRLLLRPLFEDLSGETATIFRLYSQTSRGLKTHIAKRFRFLLYPLYLP